MSYPKLYLGPMSKNVVDAAIELYYDGIELGFIGSRRQIEYDGGYVNNWTTESFTQYVKKRAPHMLVCRDHAGLGQGAEEDDGFESLSYDVNFMDIVHIDPWKKITDVVDAAAKTADYIEFCNDINDHCLYEVGTEQSIREMSPEDLYNFLGNLKSEIGELFDKVLYVVIQSGTSLMEDVNTGEYDETKLREMLRVCDEYVVLSKEHNGDYLSNDVIRRKFRLGLDAINIAPELGIIETMCVLDRLSNNGLLDRIFTLCYESGKWKKWVDVDFNPFLDKKQLIKICGHYIFSSDEFKIIMILDIFEGIDDEIKSKIKNRITDIVGG